ncbi:OLC1v1022929C1 [Oldenlandia corymbosa var. corymbosa]|uniref:OLC1v1022929C1 n=1 Tax=Oldenlandia corymbosa var. corymbosa TaxID=529605 RepID=A0AAV1C1D3_OLDCO|nr:OLC1v1022929C1 [Oldenlandia corymbosa var. corymbosa]
MIQIPRSHLVFLVLLLSAAIIAEAANNKKDTVTCFNHGSPCFLQYAACPQECPSRTSPTNGKICSINCDSPLCSAECKTQIPNCNGKGAACQDPRFIGGDGRVFYFHGERNGHFTLVSDPNLQINARFIGLRPAGRPRDYTWIQALGVLFDSHSFSVEAIKSATWNDEEEHLKFSYDGMELEVAEDFPYEWVSAGSLIRIHRASKASATITIPEFAEISVNVIPVTKEDDRIHNYGIPSDDCFAHLEAQFRFFGLNPKVEGVLGKTYRPDFVNPAKPGVAMPVVGGEDKYRTASLLSPDCKYCVFSPLKTLVEEDSPSTAYGTLDCTSGGNGIVCRK